MVAVTRVFFVHSWIVLLLLLVSHQAKSKVTYALPQKQRALIGAESNNKGWKTVDSFGISGGVRVHHATD